MKGIKRLLLLLVIASACADEKENLVVPLMENQFRYFSTSDGLISNDVSSIYQDKEGNIWVGTPEGISVFDGKQFSNFSPADGLVGGAILAISEDANGDVWVGSEEGYSVFNGEVWSTETSIGVSAMYLDHDDTFWIGTNGLGLIRWQADGVINTYASDVCELCNYYTKIFSGNEGSTWFTTLGGAQQFTDDLRQITTIETVEEFLLTGTSDEDGTIWFGAYDLLSIMRYDGNSFSSLDIPIGNVSVTGIESRDKILYVSTFGGLFYYDKILFRQLRTPGNDEVFNAMLKDSNDVLWLGTTGRGLIQFIPKDKI